VPVVRAALAIAPTREEAERQVLDGAPQLRILRSREMNLDGVAAMLGKPLEKHWAVVFAPDDYDARDEQIADPSPEDVCERETQIFYLRLAVDPTRVASGSIEEFPCPACGETVHLELPAPSGPPKAVNCQCEHCRTPLTRPARAAHWEVLPPTSTPPSPCIFCGVIDESREHAIPEWVAKQLGVRAMLKVEDASIHPGPPRRRQPISFASYKTQGFCHGCNQHFGVLEEKVGPTLQAMARGQDVELDQTSQAMLALWANKTAFALRVAENKADLPFGSDQLRAVRAGSVAPRTWVGFFSWNGGPVVATGTGRLTMNGAAQHLYVAILAFAQVGFCVTAVTEPLTETQRIHADVDRVAQIWPPRYPRLTWPWPPLDNRVVERLLRVVPVVAS
jgi:hypothetical protein